MKKFTIKAVAFAIVSVCGSAAFAGSITGPATDAAATVYAIEGLTNATALRSPAVVYAMGVGRTTVQGFTVIYTPVGGTFSALGCSVVPAIAGTGVATVTIKRQSTTECAYDVAVTTSMVATDTITWTPPAGNIASHTLATAGNAVSIALNLWDTGETARVDNSGALTRRVATSAQALSITATADTATTADVNNASGPLFGFVAGGAGIADTATTAKASFTINNNPLSTVKPDGVTVWDFNNALDGVSAAFTVAGNFTGLRTLIPAAVVGAGAPAVTITGSNATFTVLRANVTAAPAATVVELDLTAAGTASLGTARTFGVSGTATVVTGAADTLAGNAAWWTWTANAIQLSTPYMSTDAGTGVLTRFFFQNVGPAATYTAACQAETGKTVTAGTAASGTLDAGQTVIDAKNVCSFSAGIRGSVTFTINAPAANIKGAYNLGFNGNSSTFVPLERPYAAGTY